MELALFDLDNTLLSGDSDHAWADYLVTVGALDGEEQRRRNDKFLVEYQNGTLDIHAFLDFQLKPLAAYPKDRLIAWRSDFLSRIIAPMITDDALALVDQHRRRNDLMVVITATNRFVTEPIVNRFGIPHLIATELEEQNGRYTGKPAGTPSFREGKVLRLNAWLAARGQSLTSFERSYFYTDSINDLPLLRAVTNPVAVNPDGLLEKTAVENGWPVIRFHR